MSSRTSQKGRGLERAVRFIQETLLKSDPKLKGIEFTIEANKIAHISGVRHEIDLFVQTLPGSQFESAWIFECKDWKEPVGKNEVIILGEKVDALGASRGFLVARKITKHAEAQLKLDTRLTFIPCTDEFLSPLNSLELVHSEHELFPISISVKQRGILPTEHPKDLDWKDKICRVDTKIVDFLSFFKPHVDEMIARDRNENSARYRNEGTHFGGMATLIGFEKGGFMIGDVDVENLEIAVRFWVHVRRRKLISKFELKGQGRAFSFEPLNDVIPGKAIQIDVVQRL